MRDDDDNEPTSQLNERANGNAHHGDEHPADDLDELAPAGESTAEQRRARERRLRAHYRSLGQSVQESRDNINDTTVDSLGKQVERANKLFRNVTAPSEAVLDSRVLMAASDAGALKARQLKLDADAFDTDQFLLKLAHFMGGSVVALNQKNKGKGRSQTQDEDRAATEGAGRPLRWGRVGRVLASESRRAVVMDLMLGPLALEVKEKKARTQRARQKVDESQRVRPEELRAEDVEKDKQATDRMISEIARILDAYGGEGIPYLSFVLNPHSFAQSVENIFYFSFLVRDGRACIEEEINEDSKHFGEIICYSCEAPDGNNDAEGSKSQFVFELTQELWKVSRRMHLSLARRSPNSWSRALSRMLPQQEAIDVFDVQASAIPHRAKFQEQTNAKWR
ncbi:BZ3500_MvSof-1268-A1-R1_Chr1-2g01285 [Microbotryum saponariae]|uniref:Non-structural maintenance of chromosomes element 4 n=1 Tax=Microbotryum saponariae TaxID=289078 RepID=A0A2X0KHZ5_9BASI|nr:BZ3500_MvSof-1268-A1-R1_Chr1-2g01285 [Microbotryum saponariae]SCZ96975.1 BZ3501_MvSof-1269-A2-R1_Chr1-2g00883 [Microbotryum saponariae]